ncbi:MAG TPA: ABC transporter permease [Candidatus Kapabacteria bacterium]|nr:ABC transporter permease [Candidatus Kapabacteria bacterium]
MDDSLAQADLAPRSYRRSPVRLYLNWIGRIIVAIVRTLHGLGAFALITLGVTATKFWKAADVIHPMISRQISRAGVSMLPMVSFVAAGLGLVVIGQTVSLLNRYGAQEWAGVVMVTVIFRELGPLVTALLVLARVGTVIVIELSTNRATGEVEALEALGIDPIHFLVVPRVLGLAASIFSLTVYMIIVSLASGYLFAFIQDVPISPGQYLNQLTASLRWQDFALLALKTLSFGSVIAVVTCYHGLARPVRLEEVGSVTSKAVVHSVFACVLLDALFIIAYLVII